MFPDLIVSYYLYENVCFAFSVYYSDLGEEVVASPYTTLSTGRVGSYQLLKVSMAWSNQKPNVLGKMSGLPEQINGNKVFFRCSP